MSEILSPEIWAALLGALLGAWITYRFAAKLADKQFEHLREISRLDAWHTSARDFIEAFAPELAVLKSAEEMSGDAMDLLRPAYKERHAKAAMIFSQYLSASKRINFQMEWLSYCYGHMDSGEPNSPDDEESLPHNDLLFLHFSREWYEMDSPGPRVQAVQSIERLLAYALDP
jgi:hypothetical protein